MFLFAIVFLVLPTIDGSALEAQTGGRLSRVQQEAREYLRLIQVQMETLSERLAVEKPDDADRLRLARERIVRDLLLEDMRVISELLEDDDYVPALETVGRVRENLRTVISMLQDRNADPEKVKEDLEKVREKRETIGQFANQQRELRDQTKRAEQAAQDLESIRDAQAELGDMLSDQEELKGEVDRDAEGRRERSEQLDSMRAETERLASELSRQSRQQESLERLRERLSSLSKEAKRDAAEGKEQLRKNDAETVAGDPRAEELGERSDERASEAGQLKQSISALKREAGSPTGAAEVARDEALTEAQSAL